MIKIEITKTVIIKKPKFSKLKIWLKNFGIVLPKKGLIKILYEKLSNLTISKENLFWLIKLFSKEYLKIRKKFINKGIKEYTKLTKLSLFFSIRYFKKKIGLNTQA